MALVTALPWGRPLRRDDLDQLPDDGHRYELLDGALVVTPAPRPLHQFVVARLSRVLGGAAPPGVEVLTSPLDIVLADDTVVQPDVLVAHRTAFTERDLPQAPLLAVEVLSPSTRQVDLLLKRERYRSAGCPAYWVVDPDVPSLLAWELHGSDYVEVARVSGSESAELQRPFPVRVSPADLVG